MSNRSEDVHTRKIQKTLRGPRFVQTLTAARQRLMIALIGATLLASASAESTGENEREDLAQEAATQTPVESVARPTPGPQSTTSAGSPRRADNKSEKTGDIFQPSEEISEDFAVSFPVDI